MKTVSDALSEHLNTTQNFISCDLYALVLSNGHKYYYADTDKDVVYNGNTYLHNALVISRDQVKINSEVVVDTMTVKINADTNDVIEGVPFLQAAHDGTLDSAWLYLRRCFFEGGNIAGVLDLFGGVVTVKQCGGIGLELTVKAKTQGLSQEWPIRRYYPQGTYSTQDGEVVASDTDDDSCVIAPFVPLRETLL
nr:MAG TPA: protein of unknown function DUF2163 [Bacteriophage sp.]